MQGLKNKVSVVIITRNEERNIADCIESSRLFADEVVIVDSGSTDRTMQIAADLNALVLEKKWTGYGDARNYGAEKASNVWILSLDADERPDTSLIKSLKEVELSKNTVYGFKRLNFIGNTAIKYGEWNPDIKYRLYHKDATKWSNDLVHEHLIIETPLQKMTLKGLLLHYSFQNIEELESRLDKYALLGAENMIANGQGQGNFYQIKPWFRFFKSYYLKGGFKDGKLGYLIAKANANALMKKYQYLNKLLNNS